MSVEGAEVAGRLEVIVEASLKGFARSLKEKVEAASAGVNAPVGVEVEDERTLRTRIQKAVDVAAAGITAKVGIDFDGATLKAKVEAAAKAAATDVKIGIDKAHASEAAKEMLAEIEKETGGKGGGKAKGIRVPLRTRGKLWLEALREKRKAQAAVKGGIDVPVKAKVKGGGRGFLGSIFKLLRPALYIGIASVIQPAIGAIVQLVDGLVAMAGSIAPAVGTLAAVPLALSTMVTGMLGVKVATQGVGQAFKAYAVQQQALAKGTKLTTAQQKQLDATLKNLSPSARKFVKDVVGLRGEWTKMRKQVQEPLFKALAKEVKPLAKSLLPVLQKGLTGTSRTLGKVVTQTAQWAKTSRFQENLGGVMEQNNGTILAGGHALGSFLQGFLEFQRAAEPFQKRMDRYITRTGDWFQTTMRANRENGKTAAFLDKAGDRLGKTWKITKQIGSGIGGIFRAADPTGMSLLNDFDSFTGKWAKWVNSTKGQNRIAQYFKNIEPGFKEFARLIGDTGKGLLKWAEDPKIAGMLHKIRTEMGPAINDLLTNLSGQFGNNTIDFLTELARAVNNLEPLINVLSGFTTALIGLFDGINNVAEGSGGAGKTLLSALGGFLVYRKISKMLTGNKGGGLLGLLGLGGPKNKLTKAGGKGGLIGRLLGRGGVAGLAKGVVPVYVTNKGFGKPGIPGEVPAVAAEGAAGGALLTAGALTVGLMPILDAAAGPLVNHWFKKNKIPFVHDGRKDPSKQPLRDIISGSSAKAGGLSLPKGAITFGDEKKLSFLEKAFKSLSGVTSVKPKKDSSNSIFGWQDDSDKIKGYAGALKQVDKQFAAMAGDSRRAKAWRQLSKAIADSGVPLADFEKILPRSAKAFGGFVNHIRTALDNLLDPSGPKGPKGKPRGPYYNKKGNHHQKSETGNNFTDYYNDHPLGGPGARRPKPVKLGPKFNAPVHPTFSKQKIMAPRLDKGSWGKVKADVRKSLNAIGKIKPGKGAKLKVIDTAGIRKQSASAFRAANSGLSKIAAASRKAGNGAKRGMTQGMSGLASAVKTKGAAASRSAKTNAGKIKTSFNGMKGPLHTAGAAAMAGLAAGIRENGRAAVAEATAIANQVAAATRKALQVRSPSRVMKKIGGYASDGLAEGIKANSKRVEDESVKSVNKAVGSVKARLKKARAELSKMMQDRSDVLSSGKDSGESYGNVINIADANGGFLSPTSLVDELTRRVAASKAYKATLKSLKKKGMGNALYKQLLEAGVEQGGPLADQLKNATPEQLKKIKALQGQIGGLANSTATEGAKAMYGAGIQAARGLIRGLSSRSKALTKAGRKMGKAIAQGVKKELKIKSPSRVMEELGGFTVEGMTNGLFKGSKHLRHAARSLSNDLARDLTPNAHAATLYASTRKSARTNGLREAVAAAAAPLIGQLVINGKDHGEVKDALDETMFTLRKIRQGGVHGDRVA